MAGVINAVVGAAISYAAPVIVMSVSTNVIASAGAIAAIGTACAAYQQISADGIVRWCINRARSQVTVDVPANGLAVVRDGRVVPPDEYVIFSAANLPTPDNIAENGWVIL